MDIKSTVSSKYNAESNEDGGLTSREEPDSSLTKCLWAGLEDTTGVLRALL